MVKNLFFFWSSSFMISLLVMLISLLFFFLKKSILFTWSIMILQSEMNCTIIFDQVSFYFLVMVSSISMCVFIYSNKYMYFDKLKKNFMVIMMMFFLSMVLLVISSDLFWAMIGWDGLGLTSMCLIFFYHSWKSFNSAVITFMQNRIGDIFMIFSMSWLISLGYTNSTEISLSNSSFYYFFMMMGMMSKSAQVPFSSWLPLAMAAPTPVSALVHSSTLVTAGIYLFIRFKNLVSENLKILAFLMASMSILIAGSSSIGEYDLKKIIAFSTLSHIGLMMMFISLSSFSIAMVHMMIHAFFKALLFMIAGNLIHSSMNNQDIRMVSVMSMDFLTSLSMTISLFSMMGIPFLSGFYSKELFLLWLEKSIKSYMMVFMFMMSVMLTSTYSIRIMMYMFMNKMVNCYYNNSNKMIFIFLSFLSIVSGSICSNLFKEIDPSIMSLNFINMKPLVFFFLVSGIFFGKMIALKQGKLSMISFFSNMWWNESIVYLFQKSFFYFSFEYLFKLDLKGSMNYFIEKKKTLFFLLAFKISKLFLYSPPIYLIGVMNLLILMFIFLM